MILIFSAFGATANYPDQGVMRKTLAAFIDSLMAQTDQGFRLFLVGHDKPALPESDHILWHSISCGEDHDAALVPKVLPRAVHDPLEYEPAPGKGKMGDMSRKVEHGIIQAVLWAHQNRVKEFWLMRMDSDDLLACDTVRKIHDLDARGIKAVFNRTCHMFDIRTGQIAVHRYPCSNTPNALKYQIGEDGVPTPDWYYLNMNHTLFNQRVRKDRIPYAEIDFTYCIVTNTGNSISGRPTLSKVEHNSEIPLTDELVKRYSIGGLL